MMTLDEQTNSILSDAIDLSDLADRESEGMVATGQRNLDAVRSLLAARYYERSLLPPWERDLYDISFAKSDHHGSEYFVTDRATGLQLTGRFSWAVAYMRTALADPEGTAPQHSTFCTCGAKACSWSRYNEGRGIRQLGRGDDFDQETREYTIRRWGEDDE